MNSQYDTDLSDFRFVAKALPNKALRPRELARTMLAHPLSYMELPHDFEYKLYNSRLTPEALSTASEDEMYWAVSTNDIFRHTVELQIEIGRPVAETLLNKMFTRNVSKVKPGCCLYQFACYHDGGMTMYDVNLTTSHFRAQNDAEIRDITVVRLLREVAATHPVTIIMVDVAESGDCGPSWTYRELLV